MGDDADAGRDRLSKLGDGVLGHILSFLDAKEAGRAAALSSRWRDVLGSVHTVSLEQPDRPYFIYHGDSRCDHRVSRHLIAAVNAALFSRDRRPYPAAVPLRALRVSLEGYDPDDRSTVDLCLSHALRHAAPEFDLDLRFGRESVRSRRQSACRRCDHLDADDADVIVDSPVEVRAVGVNPPRMSPESDDHSHGVGVRPEDEDDDNEDEDDVSSSDDDDEEMVAQPVNRPSREYTVLSGVFSCATLRSLRLGYCRLSPPVAIRLPSVETLHLTHVPDEEEHLQRLISACPRLADLTLEACGTLTALSLLDNARLHRLALRCCHKLARLAVDAPELHSLEYRGPVPNDSFLTVRGGGGGCRFRAITSCKIDILEEEATSEEEHANLGSFLQQLASTTKHLHLRSARMGSCFAKLPAFPSLRQLELSGSVPRSDDPAVAAASMSSILTQAPNLESLSLFFEAAPRVDGCFADGGHSKGELLDAHHLHYSRYDTLDCAPAACLGSRVRKVELLQYQGGRAQRTLARFLLRNAPVLEQLYCGLAEGPEWAQRELMREMEGWVVNETASKEFR